MDKIPITTIQDYGHYSIIGPVLLPLKLLDNNIVTFFHYGFRFREQYYSVLLLGDIKNMDKVFVRISSNCQWSFYFDSQYCDCRWQLEEAKIRITKEGKGIIIFCHNHHGKGVGIADHWKIYAEGQQRNCELVVDAYKQLGYKEDYRDYSDIVTILKHFDVKNIRLLSNSPKRKNFFEENGFCVTLENLEEPIHENLKEEYRAKKYKLGHLLKVDDNMLK